MNKFLVCALALSAAALAMAAPQHPDPYQQQAPAQILQHDSEVSPDGYHFQFETSDGISRQEQGTLKQVGEEVRALTVSGSYRYTAPDGLTYAVTYTADENGFQPQQHLERSGQQ